MTDSLRGTGRTTRMLQKAKWLERCGKRVMVVAANRQDYHVFDKFLGGTGLTTVGNPLWSWESMRVQGLPQDIVYLVDPHVLSLRRDFLQRQINILNEFEGKQNDPYND